MEVPAVRLRVLSVVLLALAGTLVPVSQAGAAVDDVYSYLEDPRKVGEGQEPPHAFLAPHADVESAVRGREQTPFTKTLDGKWRIAMADNPAQVPAGFHAAGYDTSGWREVSVPHTWQ